MNPMEICEERLRSASVLIVDDTPANIGVLRGVLATEGYQLYAATSGELALKIALQTRPDLILLDVMMPGIGGIETCRQLKANPETSDIPVIFITAKTDMQDIMEGFEVGGADYISKPIRHEEVCARVRTQLQVRLALQALNEQAERFRAIVNNMDEGLLILDPNGTVQFANPAAHYQLVDASTSLNGMTLDQLLVQPHADLYREYFRTEWVASTHASEMRHGPREVLMRRHDGMTLARDLSISPIFLKRPLFIALLHDISEHKDTENELLRIARIDPLTNIANRRHFDARLGEEWQRAQRGDSQVALVVFDIDHFKQYNDLLGHQAGDCALQQVALAIKSHAKRPTDVAVRYGGEEFVLLLPGIDAAAAQSLAEAARVDIENLKLPHPSSGCAAHVTVSAGVASMRPLVGQAPETLFAAADSALYRAKSDGRNRVCRTEAATPAP
jgi:diguanylate cyclase (GGDEF)-like protein/PAS domain S-box-containing protein